MGSTGSPVTDFDVIIIGAGISGINAAYRVQTELPGHTYTIFEARDSIGGTWDFFRYPGIRSDSDLHTFGYPWRPWNEDKEIADGDSILSYIKASASQYGIDKKVQFGHKLLAADWSSAEKEWVLDIDSRGTRKMFRARFIFISTGYYDYDSPLETKIPGLETFMGDMVHPQFWPQTLDYSDKKVVIIGSGATAVTLVPALAKTAESVTMLQRSPSYVMALPSKASGGWIRAVTPTWMADTLIRWRHLLIGWLFFKFCSTFPITARMILRKLAQHELPKDVPFDPHFNPSYNPWDQRVCFCPDGDFFGALRDGNAHVVTDTIQTVSEKGILTSSGKFLEADIIITATGLRISIAGNANVTLDGTPFSFQNKYLWNGAMLQDFPNAAYVIGYGNLSWTLGADATARLICKLLREMEEKGFAVAIPRLEPGHGMKSTPILNIKSTYIQKAKHMMPMAGNKSPWRPRDNPIRDIWHASWGNVTEELELIKKDGSKKKN